MQRESDIQKEQQISVEEQEAIALAKIFIAKNNSANMRSYSHHLEDAVENHQHHLTNFLLTRIKKRFTGNDLTWINKKGFFKAASHNNLVALEKLVKTMSKKDRSSGLHVAARAGCVDAVRLLMQHGADSSYRAKHGKTVLATAIEKDKEEVVHLLLKEKKADPSETGPTGYYDLLSWAISGEKREKYVPLLLHYGANPHGLQRSKQNPLTIAACYNRSIAVQNLLLYGADPNAKTTDTKITPLIQATKNGRVQAVEVLVNGWVPPAVIRAINEMRLSDAPANYIRSLPRELCDEVCEFSTTPCADKTIADSQGNTALVIACAKHEKENNLARKESFRAIIELLQ